MYGICWGNCRLSKKLAGWLEVRQFKGKLPETTPAKLNRYSADALHAWNLMQGIDWAALPAICELIRCDNIELLIEGLLQIRNHQSEIESLRKLHG